MKLKKREPLILLSASLIILVVILSVGTYLYQNLEEDYRPPSKENSNPSTTNGIQQFKSEEEFEEFIERYEEEGSQSWGLPNMGFEDFALDSIGADESFRSKSTPSTPYRYSDTNVQVLSIDEADIVKTDGRFIYYSSPDNSYYYDGGAIPTRPVTDFAFPEDEPIYQNPNNLTKIISAFPLDTLNIDAFIEEGGNLYLVDETLLIEHSRGYLSYDVSDPSDPKKGWSYDYADDTELVTSRFYNENIYLVTQNWINRNSPCPIPLLEGQGETIKTIACTDIYHSGEPTNTTYTVLKISPEDGDVIDTFSFLGSPYDTLVYMSEENLYLTYRDDADEFLILYDFIFENEELFSSTYIQKVENLKGYDISTQSKISELQSLTTNYMDGLSSAERLEKQTRLSNRVSDYGEENIRSFTGTGIVKIDLSTLEADSTGKIQGRPPDQFALDEYNGNLRVATNVSPDGIYYFSIFTDGYHPIWNELDINSDVEEQNDVVVFDKNMNVVGEVRGLGITEDIYSSRFIGDAAYIVTFRQIDPFYVVDLSDPTNPLVKGELKIPGYSSYLHPISKNLILGVGEEEGRVKVSLFDVSDPSNPQELSKYSLGSGWSEVESNHHAFLHDPEHSVVFLPTGNGGHILSYEGNKLDLVRSIDGYDVERALYINDYMYILSPEKIVVYDENSWEKVKEYNIEEETVAYPTDR